MRNRGAIAVIALVQAVIGFEWIRAGYEKVSDPNFVGGMAKTLAVFAGKNPTGWYKDLLNSVAIPNATVFGWLVAYGEFLVGIALVLAAVVYLVYPRPAYRMFNYLVSIGSVVALFVGAFLNANFWFAAGWLSVSTDSVNTVMFLTQLVLAGSTIYFVRDTLRRDREDDIAWERLFTPGEKEQPAPKVPAGIA